MIQMSEYSSECYTGVLVGSTTNMMLPKLILISSFTVSVTRP